MLTRDRTYLLSSEFEESILFYWGQRQFLGAQIPRRGVHEDLDDRAVDEHSEVQGLAGQHRDHGLATRAFGHRWEAGALVADGLVAAAGGDRRNLLWPGARMAS